MKPDILQNMIIERHQLVNGPSSSAPHHQSMNGPTNKASYSISVAPSI
jgi:hypothetical protein